MVIHGGYGAYAGQAADAWKLDLGNSLEWSRVLPDGPTPTARAGVAIYDAKRDRIVMLDAEGLPWEGGEQPVWTYSFRGNEGWARETVTGSPPAPCTGRIAVYDLARDAMIVYGKYCYPGFPDLWMLSFDNLEWTVLAAGEHPPVSNGRSGFYDPIRDRLVFTDLDEREHQNVWIVPLGIEPHWQELAVPGMLAPRRRSASVIYDTRRDRMIIFGGHTTNAIFEIIPRNDTWALSLSDPRWSQLNENDASPTLPLPRTDHSAVYDPAGDRMIVFGGENGQGIIPPDTWELDFATGAWTELCSSGQSRPDWAFGQTAVYDSRRHRIMVIKEDYLWALELARERREPAALDASASGAAATIDMRSRPSKGGWLVEFRLPDATPAALDLYDLSGRRVWSADVRHLALGAHSVSIPGRSSPGIYFLRLAQGTRSTTAKLIQLP